jgi:hypothetical protein
MFVFEVLGIETSAFDARKCEGDKVCIHNFRGENFLENTDMEDREGDERIILKLI